MDGPGAEADGVRAQMDLVSREHPQVAFADIPEPECAGSIAAQWAQASHACAASSTARSIASSTRRRTRPLHVVRLVVPLLENFSRETMRVGPRLQAALEADADEAA